MERLPILRGTLDVLVLKALSWAPMHGFEITCWLEEHTQSALALEDSALYQALYRMEERGLVRVEWGITENNRRARYYHATEAGRTHLTAETERWLRYSETLVQVLTAVPASS